MSYNDLAWYLFFRRNRRPLRKVLAVALVLLFIAALIYVASVLAVIYGRSH
jgi:hypothetical protein